jgi:hypothetical protein
MNRYYVRKDKLKQLEKIFRADLRAIKKMNIAFNMSTPPERDHDNTDASGTCGFVAGVAFGSTKCATCLVGAHVIARGLRSVDKDEIETASRSLRVNEDWLATLYGSMPGEYEESYKDRPLHERQPHELAYRLQRYAKSIGL